MADIETVCRAGVGGGNSRANTHALAESADSWQNKRSKPTAFVFLFGSNRKMDRYSP